MRDAVPVNALVTGPGFDPAALAGYPAVKVKVAAPDDVDLVAAVRDAVGPDVALRIDANGRFDVDTAEALIARLAPYHLELVEQPVATLDDLARLRRRVDVPLAADECVRSPDDARRVRDLDAADALVVKVQPAGGVRAALELVALAGVPAVPSSMHETSVGRAAGLALALAVPELHYACGLAAPPGPDGDVTRDALLPTGGILRPRPVVPDPDLLARYSVAPVVGAHSAS